MSKDPISHTIPHHYENTVMLRPPTLSDVTDIIGMHKLHYHKERLNRNTYRRLDLIDDPTATMIVIANNRLAINAISDSEKGIRKK